MIPQSNPEAPESAPAVSQSPELAEMSATQDSAAPAKSRVSRRALLRAGAAASPVLLTLASSPVSATGSVSCMVASSFVSVATFLSRNPDKTVSCSTKNCEYWRSQAALVPTPAELGVTVAALLGPTGSSYNSHLLKDVLLSGSAIVRTGSLGVLQHCISIALSLNGGHVPTPGLVNLAYIQSVWASYNSFFPNYQSPSGVLMSEAQLVDWLRVLMYPITPPLGAR
jgi:hypothetical protein